MRFSELLIVRPGSIAVISELFWYYIIRSSMGDCHSFDPGSNPGPGAIRNDPNSNGERQKQRRVDCDY